MIKIHYSICPDHEQYRPITQLSLDGVLESKSTFNSLDTYSLKFNHCRNIYPIRIIKPCERFKYDEQNHLREVLSDINDNDVIIDCVVLDKIKRSTVTCTKNHASKFPCEYCQNSAVTFLQCNKKSVDTIKKRYDILENKIKQQIEQLGDSQEDGPNDVLQNLQQELIDLQEEKQQELSKQGRKKLTWPASTMSKNPRTLDNITAIVEEIENNPEITKTDPDFCKGIKGRSLFLNQPRFHIIKDVPCEYMHTACLGVVKRVVELSFKVGDNRDRVTQRRLSSPQLYNEKIKSVQLTRECSRRCRNLDFSVLKAAEFRNIILFFFPIVLDCIDEEFVSERKLWIHLVFMIRSCVIPNAEFRNVKDKDVESACRKFYKLYEKLFGPANCTYSIHVVGSHLLEIRGNRPLTFKSAFKFENFFSEMRNMYQPGTCSTLKQILKNCYAKRILEHHECEKTTFFKPEKKPVPGKKFNPSKENNHLVYVFNENQTITMYDIVEILNDQEFRCKVQGKFPLRMELAPEYNWSQVGVFKKGPLSEEDFMLNRNEICGKVLEVNGLLITFPNNVLHEQ